MSSRTLRRGVQVLAVLIAGAAFADNLAPRDQVFLEQAAQHGHAEQSASRLALTKTRDARVRALAQRMIDDNARVVEELRTLAASKNYTPPREPSMLQKGKEMLVGGLSEDHFDRRYVHQMGVVTNETTVQLFEEAAREARDPDVKAFATRHLPTVRDHLQTARELKVAFEPAR
ncbi:DUF4142 domain-containing protein [Hydrogenophaga sp.]|uniref:DUF4142 domain-containing protein n=1 Tax=Hydrogenophaga sp. TaxID=1904254 RepID=UPI0025BC868E|nr:DUF4142 domain-containing protein [Hydrogenophaga sp.]MBT9463020.1 DUF4142 domain-containing protein [Hydrogenophaga sp.]